MIKVAIEDLEKKMPFILQHIEAGDSFLILKGQKPMGEFRPLHRKNTCLSSESATIFRACRLTRPV